VHGVYWFPALLLITIAYRYAQIHIGIWHIVLILLSYRIRTEHIRVHSSYTPCFKKQATLFF